MPSASGHKNLILVANSAEAFLYSCENLRILDLVLIKEFTHPDSRKKISDLICDKPGHFKTDGGAHGSYEKGDPKKVEAEHFALELAKFVKSTVGSANNVKLIVVTPSHFCSLIKKHLDVNIKDTICISKDYTKHQGKELIESLREHFEKNN